MKLEDIDDIAAKVSKAKEIKARLNYLTCLLECHEVVSIKFFQCDGRYTVCAECKYREGQQPMNVILHLGQDEFSQAEDIAKSAARQRLTDAENELERL